MGNGILIKKLGILGVSMGLLASPLAFSEERTLPVVIITAEELASPSFRSDPVNDPQDMMQAAFRGYVAANGSNGLVSPSFRSEPVNDPRDIMQAALRDHLTTSIDPLLVSSSIRSDPTTDHFLIY